LTWSLIRSPRRRMKDRLDGTDLLASKRFDGTDFPSLRYLVAPSNLTDGRSIASTFQHGVDALSSAQETTRQQPSLERATEQVNALFDLCVDSFDDNFAYVSSDVALNALEGLIGHILRDLEHDDISFWAGLHWDTLENLTQRVNEVKQSPSIRTVESLWMIQQYRWERTIQQSPQQRVSSEAASKHVDRTVRLLQSWTIWSELNHTLLAGHSPPTLFLLKALKTASRHKVEMSVELWDLYSRTVKRSSNNGQRICREVHSHVFEILSYSGTYWHGRQCQVLQNVVAASLAQDGLDSDYHPSASELLEALKFSCTEGMVSDAAWLARTILNRPNLNLTIADTTRKLFLESVLNSRDAGSLLYMERLLQDWTKDDSVSVTMDMVRTVLQKYSQSRTPGSGGRAERMFHRAMQSILTGTNSVTLDAGCVHCVVTAYLHEYTSTLINVQKADRFVRQCVREYGLHSTSTNHTGSEALHARQWRVFDLLLAAYGNSTFNAMDQSKALRSADQLFQFFLVQHRDGRITSEEPDYQHLEHIIRHWKQCPRTEENSGSEKCTEYYELMKRLYERGIIQTCPDSASIQKLLSSG